MATMATTALDAPHGQKLRKSLKLCHVCGSNYPLSSIALHQSKCIKRSIKRSPTHSTRSSVQINMATLTLEEKPLTSASGQGGSLATMSSFSRNSISLKQKRTLSDIPVMAAPNNGNSSLSYYQKLNPIPSGLPFHPSISNDRLPSRGHGFGHAQISEAAEADSMREFQRVPTSSGTGNRKVHNAKRSQLPEISNPNSRMRSAANDDYTDYDDHDFT
ncbi:hypothetical protein HDU76_009350, partial [Blyttiomyces sp. JEL0837]